MNNLEKAYIILVCLIVFFLALTITLFGSLFFDFKINNNFNNIISLLPPIGIILSALLASVSILKTMENTNRIEENKKEKEEIQFRNKLKIYINEVLYILDLHKASKMNEKVYDDKSYEYLSSLILKTINHTKNLIINDANFLEKIGINEFNLIRYFNVIEIGLEEISKKYEKNLVNRINENFIEIIKEVESINDIYNLKLKLDKYK